MPDLALHVRKELTGIGLVPSPVKLLGRNAELDDKIAGQVLRFDLTALFAPEAVQRGLIVAHNDPGVRTPNEITAITSRFCPHV